MPIGRSRAGTRIFGGRGALDRREIGEAAELQPQAPACGQPAGRVGIECLEPVQGQAPRLGHPDPFGFGHPDPLEAARLRLALGADVDCEFLSLRIRCERACLVRRQAPGTTTFVPRGTSRVKSPILYV